LKQVIIAVTEAVFYRTKIKENLFSERDGPEQTRDLTSSPGCISIKWSDHMQNKQHPRILKFQPRRCPLSSSTFERTSTRYEKNWHCTYRVPFITQDFTLLDRHSTAWAVPPVTFGFGYFGDNLTFCLGQPGPPSFYFMLPASPRWQACATMLSFFPLRWGLVKFFFLPGPSSNHDPPDLSLPWNRITGMHHCAQLLVEMRSWKLLTPADLESSQSQSPK
jgi:hypothetical protein